MTHTYVELDLSRPAFEEIAAALRKAGYDHAFMEDGAIDMHGLAVTCSVDDRAPGFNKPDTDAQVFFYEQDFYVLSNFSAFNLQWAGNRFPTSEHAYQWSKFNSQAGGYASQIATNILFAESAHAAFKIAEACKEHRRLDWDAVKVGIMLNILRSKAEQHEYVRRKLLVSGDRELIEDSWRDDFWGWGPLRNGQNMLGKLWMQVRTELRAA